MSIVINTIVIILGVLGLISFLGAVVGMLRLPDFYSRMHAASKGDTMSTLCILSAFAIYNLHHFSFAELLVSFKILLIVVFIFVSSPSAAHALVEAAYRSGVVPGNSSEQKKNLMEE